MKENMEGYVPEASDREKEALNLSKALEEADDRLEEIDSDKAHEIRQLTLYSTSDEIREYMEHQGGAMSPQEKFFLEVTLQIRKNDPTRDVGAKRMKDFSEKLQGIFSDPNLTMDEKLKRSRELREGTS